MAIAKDLLRRQDCGRLAEVAERVGYGSASTFSAAFSRHVGRPPGRYARGFAARDGLGTSRTASSKPGSRGSMRPKPKNDRDPRVDAYIEALPAWQQAICRQVRGLVHAADPDVVETVKRTCQPYFTLDGNVCALLAAKHWVNVFLYDGAMVPDRRHHHERTTTSTREPSPFGRVSDSTHAPSRRCSGRLSRTTAPAAGGS